MLANKRARGYTSSPGMRKLDRTKSHTPSHAAYTLGRQIAGVSMDPTTRQLE
jgi:hypothetical protein